LVTSTDQVIRLDGLANPYGPSVAVGEALATESGRAQRPDVRLDELRARVAGHVGIAPSWIALDNGADDLLHAIVEACGTGTRRLVFPPAAPHELLLPGPPGDEPLILRRDAEFRPDIDLESAAELPPNTLSVIGSPSDPTGTLVPIVEVVRLCRACKLVVIDERNGGYGGRSHVPIVREFDNAVVIQTLETWAGLDAFPIAWAVGHPKTLARLAELPRRQPAAGSVAAALATFDDLDWVMAMVRRVREERSRLYRMLRKLNMVQPLPSWAGFLLTRVERGDAASSPTHWRSEESSWRGQIPPSLVTISGSAPVVPRIPTPYGRH
jgi:histidinol-phosphate aminotransferase